MFTFWQSRSGSEASAEAGPGPLNAAAVSPSLDAQGVERGAAQAKALQVTEHETGTSSQITSRDAERDAADGMEALSPSELFDRALSVDPSTGEAQTKAYFALAARLAQLDAAGAAARAHVRERILDAGRTKDERELAAAVLSTAQGRNGERCDGCQAILSEALLAYGQDGARLAHLLPQVALVHRPNQEFVEQVARMSERESRPDVRSNAILVTGALAARAHGDHPEAARSVARGLVERLRAAKSRNEQEDVLGALGNMGELLTAEEQAALTPFLNAEDVSLRLQAISAARKMRIHRDVLLFLSRGGGRDDVKREARRASLEMARWDKDAELEREMLSLLAAR